MRVGWRDALRGEGKLGGGGIGCRWRGGGCVCGGGKGSIKFKCRREEDGGGMNLLRGFLSGGGG